MGKKEGEKEVLSQLEYKNQEYKNQISNLTDNNSSAIKLYYDTNNNYNKYKLANILIGIFFIIGTIFFYMLHYNYLKFINFIDNIRLFNFNKT